MKKKNVIEQTAVEWLIEQLTNERIYKSLDFYEQAKQMEKEQIMKAVYDGICMSNIRSAEQYYNENYGK